MVQTRMTGDALTDKVVFTSAGFPVRSLSQLGGQTADRTLPSRFLSRHGAVRALRLTNNVAPSETDALLPSRRSRGFTGNQHLY